ncbi:MAG: hypothetical protein Q9210_003872 [Variospora velana]
MSPSVFVFDPEFPAVRVDGVQTVDSKPGHMPWTAAALARSGTLTQSVARQLCVAAVPNLVENRGNDLVATITVMLVIATLAVLLRLYARRISRSKLGVDDYLILVALILTYGLDITSFFAIKAGTGRHMITLTLDQIQSLIKTDQATQVLFGCSITATKLSILFFYDRLFPFRTFVIVSLITGVASILWWIGLMLTAFLHCHPLAYYWDRSIPNGYCVDEHLIGYTITSVNIATDLIVLILPIPWLWGMNMTVPKRMAVVSLFILGSLYVHFLASPFFSDPVCIAGIVRIPLLAELKLSDISWTSISVGVWVNVECNIGILSACLPILRPLFSTKYPFSPASCFTRVLRTATHSALFSSSNGGGGAGGGSSSDPELGVASEPSSDATIASEAAFRWPKDSTAKGWRWSRNNSASIAVPTEKEREKKIRTWYSAAADVVPEIDHAQNHRFSRAVAQIPRYRDDVQEPLPSSPPLSPRIVSTERDVKKPPLHSSPLLPHVAGTPLRRPRGKEFCQSRHDGDAIQFPPPPSPPTSHIPSPRSSWGIDRDTWDLMPSARGWDKTGLGKAMEL